MTTTADRQAIERAFTRARKELEVRTGFPDEVRQAAEEAARRRVEAGEGRTDLTAVPFVTIDPPGSRDLDQALHLERAGDGLRLRYAIADVGFFVDRGSLIEQEAWRRGVTFYAPDEKQSLYPPALSEGAASLLADATCPAVVFTLEVDASGALRSTTVEPAVVRSRRQLTYTEVRDHVLGGGRLFAGEPWAEVLMLLKEFGELRKAVETARGGVSLPLVSQHVQRDAAARLGYVLEYEAPNPAEDWNEQVSLLAGHAAALLMLDAGVGMLRVQPPADAESVEVFRTAAAALGFPWPAEMSYAEFIHAAEATDPESTTLFWQARRLMRGADYVVFQGEPPALALHSSLAMPYAHVTAPLRRLGDRYVLDLLVTLAAGGRPTEAEVATLRELPPLMDEAERRAGKLERRAVDIAEAWTLRGREGESFPAVVLGTRDRSTDVQMGGHPVLASLRLPADAAPLASGTAVRVRLEAVDVEEGRLELAPVPGDAPAAGSAPAAQ